MGRTGRKKKRTHKDGGGETEGGRSRPPKSIVMERGKVGRTLNQLVLDLRQVMEPYTATRLKVKKRNVLKDFVQIAGPLGVTHLIMMSKSDTHVNLRIARLPRGPTITFHVKSFSLTREVVASARKPPPPNPLQFLTPALLVLNNFTTDSKPSKLMTTMFQNMFPSINIQTVKLPSLRRCVLLQLNKEDNSLEFRHYAIKVVPRGVSRGVRKVVQTKVPNLSKYQDISDIVLGDNLSESEAEEVEGHVTVVQDQLDHDRPCNQQSAVKLTELGPRMTLQLVKVEAGMCGGEVLYHQFMHKSVREVKELRRMVGEKRKLKEKRRQQQEENVRRKMRERSERKQGRVTPKERAEESEDDDVEWYRQEVGVEPDPELQLVSKESLCGKRKRQISNSSSAVRLLKKPKLMSQLSKRRGGLRRQTEGGRGGRTKKVSAGIVFRKKPH